MRILALKQLHKNVLKTRSFNTSCKNDNSCKSCLSKKYDAYTVITIFICMTSIIIASFCRPAHTFYVTKKDKDIINIDDIVKP